jgi:hypothetical protein
LHGHTSPFEVELLRRDEARSRAERAKLWISTRFRALDRKLGRAPRYDHAKELRGRTQAVGTWTVFELFLAAPILL